MTELAGSDAPPQRDERGWTGRVDAEIERIAQMGSWEWDIPGDSITWSEGLYRMFGLEPGAGSSATYGEYVARLHPADRDRVLQVIDESRRSGEPFVLVHRLVRPTGEVRTVLGRGEVVRSDEGEPLRMVGTAQDVTERLQIEREISARLAAESAAARSKFLADVGEALATSSLDYEQTLRRVALLSVPRVADWCAIDLRYDDGELHRVAVHPSEPESQRPAPGGPTMTAPLVGRDGPFGAIMFANDASRREFGDEDRRLAEDLGRRAGIAIENARLYEVVRESQTQLEEQAAELEAQTAELEAATTQTSIAYDELRVTAEELLRRTDEAEASRREITAILESVGDAFFALDERWRFTYVNERAEKLLQRTRDELVGRELWSEFPDSVGTTFEAVYRRVMGSRASERFEAYFPPLDLWCDVSAFPGLTGGIAVYFQDVTSRRRAEIQFGMLAETMPQLVWSTTREGYHDYYNSRWYEYTGMPREGSQGWNWKNFLHPDDYGRSVEQWKRSLESGDPYSIEYRFREASTGVYRWFLGRALPLRDEQGRIVRWFGTCTDIDDTKRAEEDRDRALDAAQQARIEAESANRAKADFLATMSHELRTPINAALGYSELLAMGVRGPVNPAQVEDLARIQRSQRLLLSLVNDILNFARLEAGQIELHVGDVPVDDVLASIESMIAPQVASKRLRYSQSGCGDEVRVRADLEKLQQVLLNLLTNAIKFTAAGGEVELRCTVDGDWVALSVRDTGRGIAADQLNRVFEPFVQVDRHLTQSSQQGVGLGLAISRDLMRAMGGELEATSTLGVGSTFVARIPRVT